MGNQISFDYSGVTPGVQNTTPVGSFQNIPITNDTGSTLLSSAIGGLNSIDLGGSISPIDQYYSGLHRIHVEGFNASTSSASGFNLTLPGQFGYSSLGISSSAEADRLNATRNSFYVMTANSGAGRDTIYLQLNYGDGTPKTESELRFELVHEMLHESKRFDGLADAMLRVLARENGKANFAATPSLRDAAEHVIITQYMAYLVSLNRESLDPGRSPRLTGEFGYLAPLLAEFPSVPTSTDFYLRVIAEAGFSVPSNSSNGEVSASPISEVIHQTAITTLAENDNGGVALYVNQSGQIVTVAENTRYTDNMLNNYGTEWVNSDGVLEGGMTLGATARAFADWIGLDGTPGLDGGFANEDEGSAAVGTVTDGVGGDSGSQTSGSNSDSNNDSSGNGFVNAVNAVGAAIVNGVNSVADFLGFDGEFGYQGTFNTGNTSQASSTSRTATGDWNERDKPQYGAPVAPILLDLDGNGIQLTDLNRSTVFMEGDEGLKHRTAWAGAGDGVLFYDTDGEHKISDIREYVFTEWDPTATDDLAALRSRFDSNGDGKLTGTELTGFKVMKTNADGSLTAVTLASLNITQINLTEDTTHIEMPDGSVITGQRTIVMGGVTRVLANTTLATEADGSRVEESVCLTAGVRTVVRTGYGTAGAMDFRVTSVTNAAGANINNYFDDGPTNEIAKARLVDACNARQLNKGFRLECRI